MRDRIDTLSEFGIISHESAINVAVQSALFLDYNSPVFCTQTLLGLLVRAKATPEEVEFVTKLVDHIYSQNATLYAGFVDDFQMSEVEVETPMLGALQ